MSLFGCHHRHVSRVFTIQQRHGAGLPNASSAAGLSERHGSVLRICGGLTRARSRDDSLRKPGPPFLLQNKVSNFEQLLPRPEA
jgi:hypothetical protein